MRRWAQASFKIIVVIDDNPLHGEAADRQRCVAPDGTWQRSGSDYRQHPMGGKPFNDTLRGARARSVL